MDGFLTEGGHTTPSALAKDRNSGMLSLVGGWVLLLRADPSTAEVVGKPTAFFVSEVRTLSEEFVKIAILFCFLTEIENL